MSHDGKQLQLVDGIAGAVPQLAQPEAIKQLGDMHKTLGHMMKRMAKVRVCAYRKLLDISAPAAAAFSQRHLGFEPVGLPVDYGRLLPVARVARMACCAAVPWCSSPRFRTAASAAEGCLPYAELS
jgi:hypothetical protein